MLLRSPADLGRGSRTDLDRPIVQLYCPRLIAGHMTPHGRRESRMAVTDSRYHAVAFARENSGLSFDVPPPVC